MQEAGITWGDAWAAIAAFLVLAGAGWAIWWKITGLIEAGKLSAYRKVDEAKTSVSAAAALASTAREELAAYKTHVAETFVTKQGLTEQMTVLNTTVRDVGDRMDKRLDGINERLDRVIEANHKPIRRQS